MSLYSGIEPEYPSSLHKHLEYRKYNFSNAKDRIEPRFFKSIGEWTDHYITI